MKRVLSAVAVLAMLAGCASPKYVVSDITRFHTLPASPAGQTFAIVSVDEEQGASLAFRQYADIINAELSSRGLSQFTGQTGEPDYVVTLKYTVEGPSADVKSRDYNVGFNYGYWGRGWGWGADFGPDSITTTRQVYVRRVQLDIYDGGTYSSSAKQKVFEGSALSEGLNGQLEPVMPYIIQALFKDFPGASGKTQTVRVEIPDDAVAAAKPNSPKSRSTY